MKRDDGVEERTRIRKYTDADLAANVFSDSMADRKPGVKPVHQSIELSSQEGPCNALALRRRPAQDGAMSLGIHDHLRKRSSMLRTIIRVI